MSNEPSTALSDEVLVQELDDLLAQGHRALLRAEVEQRILESTQAILFILRQSSGTDLKHLSPNSPSSPNRP